MPLLSIDLTAAQATRFSSALGVVMGLGRDATLVEAKTYWVGEMRRLVKDTEHRLAAQQIVTQPFDPA